MNLSRRTKSKSLLVLGALVSLVVAAWVTAVAGPGSGIASITPPADVPAGTAGTWSITFTAQENFQDGRVRITIPSGWTAPQSTSSSSAGYITVLTNEPTGNPLLSVGGQIVTIDVDTLTDGNTLTLVYGEDAGGASARAVAASNIGTYSFLVASDPSGTSPAPLSSSPSLDVIPGAPDHLEISPGDTTVTAGEFPEYVLIVRDEFGNRAPVAGARTVGLFPSHGQFFNPSNHSTPITQINVAAGKTSVRVDYKGTLATPSGSPHTITVFTTSGSPSLGGFADVHIDAAGLSTSQSTVSASSPVVANGSSQSTVLVTSKDAFGNPRQGDSVVLGATGSAVLTQPGGVTDVDGQATGAVTNTVAQNVTVSATVEGQPLLAPSAVSFVAGPVSAATSLVTATTPVVANGVAQSTVTVTARDANNNPISGQTVTLFVTPPGGGAVLTQPGGLTNASGVATGQLASTTIGARTVDAQIGSTNITDDAVVNFTAGAAASFEWTVDGAAVAGNFEQVTLTVRDAQGNVVTNYTGTVNLGTNSSGVGNLVVEWAAPDALGIMTNQSGDNATYAFAAGDNGSAVLRVTDTKAETIILSATQGPASGNSSSIVVAPGAPDKVLLVAGNGQSATVDTPVATPPKVRVTDAFDNNVTGASVKFRFLTPGGSVDVTSGGGVDSTGTTIADGTVDCDVWRMADDTSLNPNRLRALITSGSTPSVDFSATATAGPGASLVLTPGSKNVTVGSFEQVTATLEDEFGNPKSGEMVTVVIKTGLHGTLAEDPAPGTTTALNPTARQGLTDATGKITVRYVAPAGAPLADVLDASTPNVAQSSVADVTYTTTASGGATNYRLTFIGNSTANAGQTFDFLLEAVDGTGNLDTGNTSTVTLTPEAGSGLLFSLTDFGSTTNSVALVGGQRTVFGRGTLVGNWDITGSGALATDIEAVTINDTGVIDSYTIATINPVVAGANFNVSVSARDQYGNLVDGANSNITLTAIDDVTTNPAQAPLQVENATLSSGQVTVPETYIKAESIRVRVSDGASNEGISNVFAVSAAAAHHIAKVAGDASNVPAGNGQVLTVQVFDLYNNPVANETVAFVVLTGGGSMTAGTVDTNASGNASSSLNTGTVKGPNTAKATIDNENPANLERVDYLVTTVAGPIANYLVTPSKTNPVAHEDVTITVTGRDANNNIRSQDNSTVVTLSETANAVLTATSGTLTNGVFTTTVHDDVAESFTVSAQSGAPSGTSPAITVTNAAAYKVEKVSGDTSGVTAGGTQNLVVVVRDFYNNAVPTQVVTFSIASAPDGTAFIEDTIGDPGDGITLTGANGQATVTYHTALTTGVNTINAQILDATPPAQERVTFTVNTDASSATKLVITFLGPSTAAAGATFSFKVEAKDASDNLDTDNTSLVTLTPEGGSTLQFSTDSDMTPMVTQAALISGARTFYGRGTLAGTWDIDADAGGLTGDTDVVTVTHTGVVTSYFVDAADSALAGQAFTVNIEARDTYGNKVTSAGNNVDLVAVDDVTNTPTGSPLSVAQATLVSGAVVVNESYNRAELMRVRAMNGATVGFSPVVKIKPALAYRVTNVGGDITGIIAGSTRLLTARVFDLYDNAVPGQLVSFAATSGGGSTAPPSGLTNSSGNVTSTLTTGTVAGTNVARATILDGTPAAIETDDFTVGTVAGPIANYEVTPTKTALVANELTNVTIKARDANGNYRTGDSTTNIVISHTGSATLGHTSATLSGGQFVTTVRDTVAENFTVTATTQGDTENGTSPTITVTNGPAYRLVYVSGNSPPSVPAGVAQPLRTEVRDQWNNTVPGQTVTYVIQSGPAGASLDDDVNAPSDGITASAPDGSALARLETSNTAGTYSVAATILDGTPAGRERVVFNVTSVAGGIAYYTVQMNATSTTAGVSKNVTVTAYDSNNNPVDNDVTQVDLSGDPGIGLVFGADPVTLTNGVATTTVTANEVQTYNVRASTVALPAVTGLGPAVSVIAAAPAGTISATATQNPITANGTSTTTITSGIIEDAFGNQVAAGLNVNVSATNGGVIIGGSPKVIGSNGRIVFDLRSSTTVGNSNVTMTSQTGTPPATGNIVIAFAVKPNLVCNTPPNPDVVVPGSTHSFSVQANNTTATAVNLTTATTFTFSDGTRVFSANLAANQTVPGIGGATLVFSPATIDPLFTPANYAPVATLIGTDQHDSPVNIACQMPANSLKVTSIEITGIVPDDPVVSRGQGTDIAVTVKNNGTQPAIITDIDLVFIPSDLFTVGSAPELGLSIAPAASRVFNVPVTVQAGAQEGDYQIDAVASGTVGGEPVSDGTVAPHPLGNIEVTTAANLAYETATMIPTIVSRGDSYAFEIKIRNLGSGLVLLDSVQTRLTFTDGTRTYSAGPEQPYAIAGEGATQTMNFRLTAVPALFTPGSYAVTLNAHGTENGAPFNQAVPLTGSNVQVVTPAVVTEAPGGDALNPDQVSKTTTAAFTVMLRNTGQATVVLTPGTTTIRFGPSNQYTAALNATGPTSLGPGDTELQFLGATVSGAIPSATYNPTVTLNGSENGMLFSQSIVLTDGVVVQDAPAIAILAMNASQSQYTVDQAKPITVSMVVRNNGGAAADFTAASLRFIHAGQDRTGQFVVSTPSTFVNGLRLSAGETDTIVFNISDNTGNSTTPGNMTIEGELELEDVNTQQPVFADTDVGGKGNLMVMTPAAITFDAVISSKTTVTQSMTQDFVVRAIVRNTGGSDAVLALTSPTTRLVFAPAPGWASTVRPALGNGGQTLSGGEVDTLIFDVTTSGSTSGNAVLSVFTAGVETNSDRVVPGTASGLESVLVETPGSIQIVSVVPSQASITSPSTLPWTITVTVNNAGESDVDLDLGAAVGLTFQNETVPPARTIPGALAGGGTLLSGGETDQFVISLTTAGTFASFGNKTITVDIDGTELNSGVARNGNDTGSILVQRAPDASYISLTPPTVSRLTSVAFAVTISNVAASDRATLTLDRNLSRLRFGSNQFNVGLTPASPVVVAQGAQATLQFTSAVIAAGIPTGVQADAVLELHWTHNGVAGTETIPIGSAITVQTAPALSILSVRSSRATMTRGQLNVGTVTMVVRNTGGADVDLDLSPGVTRLGLNVLGPGTNVTGEYDIQSPTELEFVGGTVLAGGATDSLIFDLDEAGDTAGTIIVSGFVSGTDLNSQQTLTDNTGDGGSGSFQLQLPGVLSILSITPAQTTATVGQAKDYLVKVAVRNTGGASVDIELPQPNSDLSFSGAGGWGVNQATMPGGVTLAGGETDTLRFLVTTTGGPSGVATISGNVSGTENNTGATKVDDTTSGGTGSITLQTPAVLVIGPVTVSQPSITASTSSPWTTTIPVQNTGQSAARLDLPAGFTIAILHQTGGQIFAKPFDLEEGGVLLPGGASGTLVATTTSNGTFSSFGPKTVTVGVGATEVNSDRVFSTPGTASILVQSAPNLVVQAIRPTLVTRGSLIDFEVDVQNFPASSATVNLNRGTTRVHFASNAFSAVLDLSSPDVIVGGATETLHFEGKIVPASVAVGQHNFNVALGYTANNVTPPIENEVVTNGLTIQAAPQLFIQQIVASQTTVTADQSDDWTATMTVVNNGTSDITLDLAPAKTFLTFIAPGGQPDPTYSVDPPVMQSGDNILAPSESGQILFTVTETGTQAGNVVISGKVEGRDPAMVLVTDDTFDGGRGGILVQSLASVAITATHTTQPQVTVGQTGWAVRVLVANTGGADVRLNLAGSTATVSGGTTFGTPTLIGGGDVLEGGSVDSLLFQVTATGAAGPRRIDASVPWTEVNNSLNGGTANTVSSGFGQIVIETRANLRITTTTASSPNPASVNVNQAFNITVQITNSGEADARNVVVGMTSSLGGGGSTIVPPAPLAVVPGGGGTVSYALPVTADNVAHASEIFTTTLTTAIDENSGLEPPMVTLTNPPLDATATLAIETPAVIDITNVRPSQASVTRGQPNPWSVIVRLRNTGGSDAVLTPPDDTDLGFSIAGATKVDYAIQPPTAFGSGAAGWTLPGNAVDSLIYNIVATGNDPGVVDIAATTAGTDRNDPLLPPISDTGQGSVNVQDIAGVFISGTVPVGTFNHADATRDTVNTSFAYQIHVTVQNSGGEDVDSVLVNLVSNDPPAQRSTIVPPSQIKKSIAAGLNHTFVFGITAPASINVLETFTSSIMPGVRSHNSGQIVNPQPALDDKHQVVTQTRANLSMNLWILSPPGSVGGVVGTNQQFTLGAKVSNLGPPLTTANVTGPAEVTLTVPSGFVVVEPVTRAFAPGDTVRWTATAPGAAQPSSDFVCAITTTPNDVNTAATAFVSKPSDPQSITVSTGGALANPSLVVVTPAGAVDDTVSAIQDFEVRASITVNHIKTLTSTLSVPAGFQITGSPIHNFPNGAGVRTWDYDVRGPANPAAVATLSVAFAAVDTITGAPVPGAVDTLVVTVVPRTRLSVAASVTAPPEAIDNTVATGAQFTVTANVSNLAGAAGIAAPGSLQIALPAGYSLAGGETADKPFSIGTAVSWVVNAAAQPSGPNQIMISIAGIPDDENSGEPAQVANGTATIAMVTEGAAVSVSDVSEALDVGQGVSPGGGKDLDVLGFAIAYNVTDTNVSPAEVDTIAFTILDKDGRAVSNGTVGQTLARLAVDLGGTQPYEVLNPSTNPVIVSFVSGGTDRDIAPDGSINAIVYLDLDPNPRATEIRVRASSMVVRDPGSGPLTITDTLGRPLTTQLTSEPLVVLSSDFEEYAHNAPNPFRAGSGETRISYFLDAPVNIEIKIYDITGALVYEESIPSSDPRAQSGPQAATWDGRNMKGEVIRNGIYVCVVNAGSKSAKFRIAVAK